jgi:pimeloyl-ACP methyl ester carboxylesterase
MRGERELVFVHGLGMSARYMEPTMRALAGEFAVSALDLPGFGESRLPGRVLSLRELASVLGGWLQARGIVAPILVGNSHGCQVIVELVWRSPDRASAIVLTAPTMEAGHRTRREQIARAVLDAPREPPSLAPLVLQGYLRAGLRRVLATLLDALADRIEDKLPRIGQPVVIVCGERDPLSPPAWGERLARLTGRDAPGAEGARFRVMEGEPHAMPFGAARQLAGIVRELAGTL